MAISTMAVQCFWMEGEEILDRAARGIFDFHIIKPRRLPKGEFNHSGKASGITSKEKGSTEGAPWTLHTIRFKL